ncbi:MAG: hypothetical protein AB2L24_09540 [Mangrovibacterium sp.]
MKGKNNIIKYLLLLLFPVCFVTCQKADDFKTQLDGIPQISYGTYLGYKYKASYVVGDTMKIVGILYPGKGLKVRIGDADAPIVKTEVIFFYGAIGGRDTLDRVSVIITEAMGTGENRPVSLTLGDNTVEGSPVTIYGQGGEGTLSQSLKLVAYTNAPVNKQNTYLHCINGKGDVYYLGFSDKILRHVAKDGTVTTLLTQDELKAGETFRFSSFTPFLAGGVNPQGTKAWVSIACTSPAAYRFVEIDLQTREVKTLNVSTAIASPYQGAIGEVNAVISGIYPDSRGNVYVLVGNSENNALAVVLYDSDTGQLSYIYKTTQATATDVPGSPLTTDNSSFIGFRFYPEEASLYLQGRYSLSTGSGEAQQLKGMTLYNLRARLQLSTYQTSGGTEYIGPFGNTPKTYYDSFFGKMPLPGQRLIGLGLGDASTGLPRWLVLSFSEERSYGYTPGKFDTGGFTVSNASDQLLNYDEEGMLYMTAGSKAQLVKTTTSEPGF